MRASSGFAWRACTRTLTPPSLPYLRTRRGTAGSLGLPTKKSKDEDAESDASEEEDDEEDEEDDEGI